MNKLLIILAGVVVLVIAILFFGGSGEESQQEVGDFGRSPDLELKDYEGNTVNLADFRGKVAVLNSWAVWCPFCRDELPDFAKLQKEFGDEIVVVAIDRRESLEKAKQYTDSLGITNDMIFLLDPDDSFYRSIGGFSMPETIFLDKEGNIRIHKRGPMPLEEMREKVESLISLAT